MEKSEPFGDFWVNSDFTEINKCALFLQFSQEVYIKRCISCSIFDTVDDYSSTGCGLETDRVWLSLRVCLRTCVPSPLWLPKETRTHTIFTSSSERKKENKLHHFVVLLLLLLLSVQHLYSSPECQAHEWLEDGDALTFTSPEMGCGVRWGFLSVFIPGNWCHGFSRCEESGSQLCVCVRAQKGF